VLVVAEMPGVGAEDVKVDIQGDILALSAERGTNRYRTEVLLPGTVDAAGVTLSCNNGMVEIHCPKEAANETGRRSSP